MAPGGMGQDHLELEDKIERCERLAAALTDDEMRSALRDLAEQYKVQLERRSGKPFMLSG